jgi:peptidoglycan/LPS O-acetylase OafA/YrhL
VRGFAVLLVFLYHAFILKFQDNTARDRIAHWIFMRCWVGVDLFFVLSGFLITGILLRSRDSANYYRVFYARRALRIAPLYYGVAIGVFLLRGFPSVPFSVQIFYWLNLSNLISAFHPALIPQLSHYWSLGIEEQFYFVWPLIVRRTGEGGLVILCICTIAGCSLLRNIPLVIEWNHRWDQLVYRLTPFRVDTLCAGALLAVLLHRGWDLERLRRWAWVAFTASGTGFLVVSFADNDIQIRTAFTLMVICSSSLIMLALNQKGRVGRFFSNSFLRRCGKYSYCLYLVHIYVIGHPAFVIWLLSKTPLPRFAPRLTDVLIAAILFAISYGISALSWRFFEEPILAFKRHFPYLKAGEPASSEGLAPTTP